jgi:hypothetical protein
MKILALAVALMFIASAVAFGGANPTAKTAVHVQPHNAKQSCGTLPYFANSGQIVTTTPGCNIDAFPVFFSLTAYQGFEYGMCWEPVACLSSCSFTNCADLVIGDIKWSGDGVSQTYFLGVYAYSGVPGWGWFYAYCPAVICVCPHPGSGQILVLDPWGGLDEPVCNFCAGVCGAVGDSPTQPTGTERSTWGAIKSMFE